MRPFLFHLVEIRSTSISFMNKYPCKYACQFFLIIGLVNSCQVQPKTNVYDSDAVKSEVTQMFDVYHKAIDENGLLGEFEFLDTSANFFWVVPGSTAAIDIDSVKTILAATAPKFVQVHFHWQTLDIFPLSNTLANFTGITKGSMKDTSGVDTQVAIIESGTVIKRSDGWKLLSGQSANLVE